MQCYSNFVLTFLTQVPKVAYFRHLLEPIGKSAFFKVERQKALM